MNMRRQKENSLIIISAAEGEAAVVFKGIRNPNGVKENINKIS
jgi:hypothetical protein